MKYDNLRLCNDYIADMEGQLDAIAQAVGVKRGKPEELLAAVRSFSDVNAKLDNATTRADELEDGLEDIAKLCGVADIAGMIVADMVDLVREKVDYAVSTRALLADLVATKSYVKDVKRYPDRVPTQVLVNVPVALWERITAAAKSESEIGTRNWTKDAAHENGNYECSCVGCGKTFIGHKRRVLCKVCHDDPNNGAERGHAVGTHFDKGPWHAEIAHPQNRNPGWSVGSDDFTHDVVLYLSGDFKDDAQQRAYAEWLAGVLTRGCHSQVPKQEPTT